MKLARALLASVVGLIVVVAIVFFAGVASGADADLCRLLGSSLTGTTGWPTWLLGAAGQLVIAIVAGIVYAAIFEWVTNRAGAAIGFIVALGHVVVAGLATGFLPATQLYAASIAPPGAFMEYRGATVVFAFVAAHLVFGILLGILYGRPRHRPRARVAVWRDVSA